MRTIICVVEGRSVPVEVGDTTPLRDLRKIALTQIRDAGRQPGDWEMHDESGYPLSPDALCESLTRDETVLLSRLVAGSKSSPTSQDAIKFIADALDDLTDDARGEVEAWFRARLRLPHACAFSGLGQLPASPVYPAWPGIIPDPTNPFLPPDRTIITCKRDDAVKVGP